MNNSSIEAHRVWDGVSYLSIGMIFFGIIIISWMHAGNTANLIRDLYAADPVLATWLFSGLFLSFLAGFGRMSNSRRANFIGLASGLFLVVMEITLVIIDVIKMATEDDASVSIVIIMFFVHLYLFIRWAKDFYLDTANKKMGNFG